MQKQLLNVHGHLVTELWFQPDILVLILDLTSIFTCFQKEEPRQDSSGQRMMLKLTLYHEFLLLVGIFNLLLIHVATLLEHKYFILQVQTPVVIYQQRYRTQRDQAPKKQFVKILLISSVNIKLRFK